MKNKKTIGEFKIEKNIPMPTRGRGMAGVLTELEVGDSFEFSLDLRNKVSSSAYSLKPKDLKFAIRRSSKTTYRIWRIK